MNIPAKTATVLAACVFSLVVVLPFYPTHNPADRPFALELSFQTDTAGYAQLYYDAGQGYSEAFSARLPVEPGGAPVSLRFPLPAQPIYQLRFDPIDRAARINFSDARITDDRQRVIHRFLPQDFAAQNEIAALAVEGPAVRLETSQPARDPVVAIRLDRALALAPARGLGWLMLHRGLPLLVGLLLVIGALRQTPGTWRESLRIRWNKVRAALERKPQRAVAMAAVLAVTLSSYPVVFLGRSFVSPNFSDGTYLLYDQLPTLPRQASTATEDGKGSDVGAIFWAHIPYSFVQSRALFADGELPLWNRYNSCGTVLLGQGQSMFGDPLHLPVLLTEGAAWAWDLKYLLAKWFLCAGLGLIVLHGTRHLASAALACLATAFLGFFLYRLNHPAFFSFCYAPWILYSWLRLADAGDLRQRVAWILGLVLACVAELHSGTVKEAYMLLLGVNLSGLIVVLANQRPWREQLVVLAAAGWAGVLFVLLTAPSWLTFLDALKRAATSYDTATAFQIQPSVALGLFDEVFYRPLQGRERVFNPSANFLVLAGLLYFLAAFRDAARSPLARGLAWSTLVPAALVFGVIPPQWIVRVPFLGNVAHIDNTFSCLLIIHLVALAGFGWRAAFERLGTVQGGSDLVRIAWGYAILVVPWLAFMHVVHRPIYGDEHVVSLLHWGHRVPVSSFVWASLLILTVASVVLLLVARRALSQRRLDTTGVLLLCAALAAILWRHGAHLPQLGPAEYVFAPGPRVKFHARSPAIAALKADQPEPSRAFGFGSNLFPGWTGAYRLEGVNGPDALMNSYYRQLVEALALDRIWDWRIFASPDAVAPHVPALDFLNVRHYVDLRSDQGLLGRLFTPVALADLDIYRSESSWPRAFFSSELVVYDSPAELGNMVRSSSIKPFAAIQRSDFVNLPSLSAWSVSKPTQPGRPARDYRLTTNTTAFTIDAPGPGIAVLHETYEHREFEAQLDGTPVPLFRVNHAFKAVAIPHAGAHRIEFRYRPRRFSLALALASSGAVLIAATGFAGWRLVPGRSLLPTGAIGRQP